MTLGGLICILIGFFVGLLSCKHRITDYDKAIIPFKTLWNWLKSKITGKSKEQKETKDVEREENKGSSSTTSKE